jgi:hypothetical protein
VEDVIWIGNQFSKTTGHKDIKSSVSSIDPAVTTKDHNETLVGIHIVIGSVFVLGLIGSPWIIARNFRDAEQIPLAIIVFGIVFLIAVLLLSTAVAMRRQKPVGRKLGLLSAAVLIIICWPAGIYSWWFLHSDGAKRMYGVKREQ